MMQRQRLLENALLVMKNAHAPYSFQIKTVGIKFADIGSDNFAFII